MSRSDVSVSVGPGFTTPMVWEQEWFRRAAADTGRSTQETTRYRLCFGCGIKRVFDYKSSSRNGER